MNNPHIHLRSGIFIDSDISAEFAWAYTDDGLISYFGYDPRALTFEQAAESLEECCKIKKIKIIAKPEA